MNNYRLSLFENSISFANEAIEKAILAETNSSQWKFAIFSLVQAVELIFKECLRLEHEIFIFSNIDTPSHTVSMDLAITRLKNIKKLNFLKKIIKQ